MAKSFVATLPNEVLNQLNHLIRFEKYSNVNRVLQWLEEQGLYTSRSAVGRYCLKLKELDGYAGRGGSNKLIASIPTDRTSRLDELYKEYGEIEIKKKMLEKEIEQVLQANK